MEDEEVPEVVSGSGINTIADINAANNTDQIVTDQIDQPRTARRPGLRNIPRMFPKQSPEKAEVEDEELLDYDDEEMVDGDMNQKEGQTKKDDGDILKAAKKLLQASNQEQNIRSCLEQRLALQRVAQDLVQLEQSLLMVNPTRMSLERLQSAVDQNKQHTMRAIKRMEEADNKSRNHNELMSEAARMAGQAATTYPWSKEAKKTYQMDYEDRLRTVQASIDTLKTTYRPNMSAAGCSSTNPDGQDHPTYDTYQARRTRCMVLGLCDICIQKKHMNKCELSHVCKACRRWGHNTTMCRYYEDVDKIIADLEEELKKIDRPEPSGQ
ncbi:hypothetical protein QR680_010452 [Steinernema hermaphroditum]|uniref:Uncharacterized protein n=1 Tax=Steinernema hermaphroditum TaxID=289476 RepID=A0AA39MBU0_9BILA|nr:hypothetical protein QR680_010452 [Steinernema hermaphroditum]